MKNFNEQLISLTKEEITVLLLFLEADLGKKQEVVDEKIRGLKNLSSAGQAEEIYSLIHEINLLHIFNEILERAQNEDLEEFLDCLNWKSNTSELQELIDGYFVKLLNKKLF